MKHEPEQIKQLNSEHPLKISKSKHAKTLSTLYVALADSPIGSLTNQERAILAVLNVQDRDAFAIMDSFCAVLAEHNERLESARKASPGVSGELSGLAIELLLGPRGVKGGAS